MDKDIVMHKLFGNVGLNLRRNV